MTREDTTTFTSVTTETVMKKIKFGWDIEKKKYFYKAFLKGLPHEVTSSPHQIIDVFPGCCSFRFIMKREYKGYGWKSSIGKEMLDSKGNSVSMRDHLREKHYAPHKIVFEQYLKSGLCGGKCHTRHNDDDFPIDVENEISLSRVVSDCTDLGTFRYRFEMTITTLITIVNLDESSDYPENLVESMGQLFETGHLSDFTIITADKDKPIKAHKSILASRSPVFKAMFDSDLEESKTNVLKRDDIDPESMKVFLKYLYTEELDFEETSVELKTTVFKLAHQYQIPRLDYLCESELEDDYDEDSTSEILLLAHTYNLESLKKSGIEYIKSNKLSLALHPEIVSIMAQSKELGLDILAALFN